MFSQFGTSRTPTCDGQMGGRTDRHDHSIYHASIASHSINRKYALSNYKKFCSKYVIISTLGRFSITLSIPNAVRYSIVARLKTALPENFFYFSTVASCVQNLLASQ